MKQVLLKTLKQGDFFRLSSSESSPVWIRGYYERSERKYECYQYGNVNRESFLRGNRIVWIDFEF